MSVFGSIRNAIFGRRAQAPAPAPAPPPAQARAPAQPAPAAPAAVQAGAQDSTIGAAAAATAAAVAAPAQAVDVDAVLAEAAAEKGQQLNYKSSIVDLMKLLDLDSSLDNRKELATELGYTGEKNGSAEMNVWLHKAVMRKLEENGGQVSADLKD